MREDGSSYVLCLGSTHVVVLIRVMYVSRNQTRVLWTRTLSRGGEVSKRKLRQQRKVGGEISPHHRGNHCERMKKKSKSSKLKTSRMLRKRSRTQDDHYHKPEIEEVVQPEDLQHNKQTQAMIMVHSRLCRPSNYNKRNWSSPGRRRPDRRWGRGRGRAKSVERFEWGWREEWGRRWGCHQDEDD